MTDAELIAATKELVKRDEHMDTSNLERERMFLALCGALESAIAERDRLRKLLELERFCAMPNDELDVLDEWESSQVNEYANEYSDSQFDRLMDAGDALAAELENCRAERDALRERLAKVETFADKWNSYGCVSEGAAEVLDELNSALAGNPTKADPTKASE